MNDRPLAHCTVEVDGVALKRGVAYHGGVLLASGGTATVALYDGLNADTGDLIDFLRAGDGEADRHVFERGIDVREGLYVDVGSNVSKLTIYYRPQEAWER